MSRTHPTHARRLPRPFSSQAERSARRKSVPSAGGEDRPTASGTSPASREHRLTGASRTAVRAPAWVGCCIKQGHGWMIVTHLSVYPVSMAAQQSVHWTKEVARFVRALVAACELVPFREGIQRPSFASNASRWHAPCTTR